MLTDDQKNELEFNNALNKRATKVDVKRWAVEMILECSYIEEDPLTVSEIIVEARELADFVLEE